MTVRGWIRDGQLLAYRFRGREYRIPESADEEFREQDRGNANMYANGVGVSSDDVRAYMWYNLAVAQGRGITGQEIAGSPTT